MITKVIGLIIGALILIAGLYYLSKNKDDTESKQIYTIFTIIGAVICLICILLLIL